MFVFFELGTRIAYVFANVFPFFVEISYEALNLSLTTQNTRVFRAARQVSATALQGSLVVVCSAPICEGTQDWHESDSLVQKKTPLSDMSL